MIVVVGHLKRGTSAPIARAIAGRGGSAEVVGAVAPDDAGDRLLIGLAAAGVGHAAVLRSRAPDLDPADLDLALRYLPEARVIVLVGEASLVATAAAAASWSGATLIIVSSPGEPSPDLPSDLAAEERLLVLAPPGRDPDGAFAGLVAEVSLRLDAGDPLAEAWPSSAASLAIEPVSDSRRAAAIARPAAPVAPSQAPRSVRPASDRRSGRR